jgi:hypothetical protein
MVNEERLLLSEHIAVYLGREQVETPMDMGDRRFTANFSGPHGPVSVTIHELIADRLEIGRTYLLRVQIHPSQDD